MILMIERTKLIKSDVVVVIVYSALFMDWKTENPPFQRVSERRYYNLSAFTYSSITRPLTWEVKFREKFWGALGSFSPDRTHERRKPDMHATTDQR